MRVVIVGRGRAGGAFAGAFERVGGEVYLVEGSRLDGGMPGPVSHDFVLRDVDLVLLAVPDDRIADVASHIEAPGSVIAHCAGSRGLDVLGDHPRVASIHPLMSLPDAVAGADRLLDRCTFAVAGDPIVRAVVERFGGRAIEVADEARAVYHAAACVAANHLVVICAQVERLAGSVGVPVDAYWAMMRETFNNVERTGAPAALTGPAARGDDATLAAHVDALPAEEVDLYRALAVAARALAAADV